MNMGLKTMSEELKQRLRDMGTLSDSKTPEDALKYIEQLEDELQEAQQWTNYWAELWERSSNLLMQHHPAFTETTEVISKDKKAFIKELFGEDLLVKVSAVEDEEAEDNGTTDT